MNKENKSKEEFRINKEMFKDNISKEFKEFCSQVGEYFGNPEDAFLCQEDPHVNLAWNYLTKKYEAKIEKLEQEMRTKQALSGASSTTARELHNYAASLEKKIEKLEAELKKKNKLIQSMIVAGDEVDMLHKASHELLSKGESNE